MTVLKRIQLFLCLTLALPLECPAQSTGVPVIGAQVFIEPGRTAGEIDNYFRILHDSGMEVARIRLFESHMRRDEGEWDYSLYDEAFLCAGKYGIKLFATLFPEAADGNTDVGGFKIPADAAHQERIGDYIAHVVPHFRDFPTMYTWVLQNEPGGSGNRDAQTAYLEWIASEVQKYDRAHYRQVNPHQILDFIPEYDFAAYRRFLTSLGASMHPSWHFGRFSRPEYTLGVSLMSDIIHSAALGNPFWITELQGGKAYNSGQVHLCPTGAEIEQWLWTGIAAGAEGIIFWTLNPRLTGIEAGEWSLLNDDGTPSERLKAASRVAATLRENEALFSEARPCSSGKTLFYDPDRRIPDSLITEYRELAAYGITPEVCAKEDNLSAPEYAPFHFNEAHEGVLVRTMVSADAIITLIINKTGSGLRLRASVPPGSPDVIYGNAKVRGRRILLPEEDCSVIVWK